MTIKIYYGNNNTYIDVTDICLTKLINDHMITIPCGDDNRARYFTDPLYAVKKIIVIEHNNCVTEYDDSCTIKINTYDYTIHSSNEYTINSTLLEIQSKLKLNYGSFYEELPEQKMVVRYLIGKEKVLEIGGNIGRNSLVIASILENSNNLVTLESDTTIANQLTENRDMNNFHFNIEPSALSNRKLIQKDWDTLPSDVLQEGYTWVNTITLDRLKTKYNIEFDTLVLDCEGAFYYILLDMPEILNGINLIIMENDYHDASKKDYIDETLKKNNFMRHYVESGGWGPCSDYFFEVWKRVIM
uniref:Methyltransferase FkbM domain-containing protein n=1 Tax=viral metagenome TaxID=1070528 RepID=A0A6C0E266_9ZZZZ